MGHSNRLVYVLGLAMFLSGQIASAQVTAGDLTWQRDLEVAVKEARQSGRRILAFFCDVSAESSKKAWASLYDSSVAPVVRDKYVPLLVDYVAQKSLVDKLQITTSGVVVLYEAGGSPVRVLTSRQLEDPKAVKDLLDGASGTAAPAPSAPPASSNPPPASAGSSPLPGDAVAAAAVNRGMLGQETKISGEIVVVEPSTGPRIPFVLTLTQRAVDPVQVVYWEQTAAKLHEGRGVPKKGGRVTVKGKLTDYKGRLQIKVEEPSQMKLE